MGDYAVTVNSTVDLPKKWLKERGISVIALKYTIDGETYEDMSGLPSREFFRSFGKESRQLRHRSIRKKQGRGWSRF